MPHWSLSWSHFDMIMQCPWSMLEERNGHGLTAIKLPNAGRCFSLGFQRMASFVPWVHFCQPAYYILKPLSQRCRYFSSINPMPLAGITEARLGIWWSLSFVFANLPAQNSPVLPHSGTVFGPSRTSQTMNTYFREERIPNILLTLSSLPAFSGLRLFHNSKGTIFPP